MRLTLAVAAAGLAHLVAASIVIFTLPVDLAKATLGLLALATDVVILLIVLGGIGRFLRRRGELQNLRAPGGIPVISQPLPPKRTVPQRVPSP